MPRLRRSKTNTTFFMDIPKHIGQNWKHNGTDTKRDDTWLSEQQG